MKQNSKTSNLKH